MKGQDEFVRCKLFPPVSDGQAHTIRYYQRAGTAPRLFGPPPGRAALGDPTRPLFITEGEKKALKANREGPRLPAAPALQRGAASGASVCVWGLNESASRWRVKQTVRR